MLGKNFRLLTITLLTLLSTVTFAAVHTQYSSTVCSNTPYLFGCDKLTTSGAHSQILPGDSTVTVNLTFGSLKATAYTATIEPGQTYLFGCQKLTADATETNTLQQAGCECDSTVTLTLQVQAPAPTSVTVAYTANIYDGETYLFGCQKLTAAGPYTETFQRVGGGDSIVNLTLNVNPVPVQKITVEYNTEIEVGQTYLFGCKTYTYTETGPQTLKDSVQAVNGGDSIIIVHLTVSAGGGGQMDTIVGYTASIKTGETYLFGCQKLTTAGVYKDTLQRANVIGDSITVLTLNVVEPSVTVAYTANIYDGETYLFGCQKLTVAGPYTETFQRVGGGDSIVNLTLNVNPLPDVTVGYTATIKQGQTYLFGCQKLTTAGPYTETFQRVAGGDSIVNLTLDVLATTYLDTTIAACDSLVWIHETIKTSGDYIDTIPNVAGGDSIVTLHLTINHPTTGSETITECDVFNWHGKDYTTSGTYVDTLTSLVTGCDSIVTLNLTINHSDVGEETITACDSIEWKGQKYYTSGDYQFDTLTVLGCDSTIILHLTVNYSGVGEETITACDSVMWKGQKYTASGDYQFDTLTVAGCDSIITLHLTINHSDVGEETATACDSYTWKGTTYTASGDYTFDTLTVLGCDSIITLHLTIRQSTVGDTTAVECNSFDWYGTTYTESGDYQHILTNVAGCDSTLTMHLTIHKSDSTIKPTPTEPVCHSYYWAEADTTIINSGTYTHVFQNQYGCDSVVTFTVTINMPYVDTLEVRAYYGWRIIMINRNQINSIEGWSLDSLQGDHPEYVKWHQIDLNGNDTEIATGYYYTLASGEPLPTGYQYYAIVEIPAAPGVPCGAFGRTETITIGAAAPAPALVPSLARPGEDIQVINLDPAVETTIRVYSADGILQKTLTSNGDTYCTIKAADAIGFYLVEIISDDMKSTLRYMVK